MKCTREGSKKERSEKQWAVASGRFRSTCFWIERFQNAANTTKPAKDHDKRERIVKRIAAELRDGFYVNLGIGMPTLVANHVPPGINVVLQAKMECWASGRIRSRARKIPI